MRAATVALHALAHAASGLAWNDLPVWGEALGGLVGDGLGVRRAHVVAAMRRAEIPSPESAASAMYRSLGTSVAELLWLSGATRRLADYTHIDAASARALDDAHRRGRGMVLAATHTGNWDLAACAMAQRSPLMVVTKHLSMRGVDAFWQASRARHGVTLVQAQGAMARARAHVKAGGAVAMMIDQVPLSSKHATRAPFLGADADVDRAPFALAAATGATLLVTTSRREASRHALSVERAWTPPERAGSSWIQSAAIEATRALDAFVRSHPEAWLWMHRRWKRAPDQLRTTGNSPERSA